MKKLLATVLSVMAAIMLLTTVSFAKTVFFEDDYVAEGDLVLAMINGTRPFLSNAEKAEYVEDACYWIADYASKYNIKYVSFLGDMSSGTNYNYNDWVPSGKVDYATYLTMNESDKEWMKDFESMKLTATLLSDANLPYGISIGRADYAGSGMDRRNHIQTTFSLSDMVEPSGNRYYELNVNNFAIIITVGDVDYIVYQLEAYPTATTIAWFNATQALHQDKRAIVFTTSFLDKSGEMYTQHDWSLPQAEWLKIYRNYNTTITSNMLNSDKPHEGNQLWKDAFADWANIIFIGSGNAKPGTEIKTKTLKGNKGNDVIAAVSCLEGGYSEQNLAYPVLIKISADNKTIDLRYAVPYYEMVGGYVEESKITVDISKLATLAEPNPYTKLPKVTPQSNGANVAYINGYDGNIFKPNDNMTKAEACKIFASLLAGTQDIPGGNTTRFTDVAEDQWYYNAVAYLDSINYFYTTEGTTFNPDADITRAEFVELAYFASNSSTESGVIFTDVPKTSRFYDAILSASASGLVNGYGDGTFKPDATITRAEVVTIINRLLALVADEEMVSKDHLETKFNDIEGHWAEYQILMASNDAVRGDYYFNVDKDTLKTTATSIYFENDYIKVSLAKKGGKVNSIINKMNGEEINKIQSANPWFTWIIGSNGTVIQPSKLNVVDGLLQVVYKNGMTLYFIVEVHEDYFSVQLDTNLPQSVEGVALCNLSVSAEWELDNENAFGISGISMTTTVNNFYVPGGKDKIARGITYSYLGVPTLGAKIGVAFSRMTEHREHLKSIVDDIDRNVGIASTHGGPYSYDHTDIFRDYVIQSSGITPDNIDMMAPLYAKYHVGQLDLHQGGGTFIHGSFNFVCARTEAEKSKGTFITAEVFKERIGDKVIAEGVQLGLHTYSSLVSPQATEILSDPKWQNDFIFAENTYTLRGELSRYRKNIKTNEDASTFKTMAVGGDVPWNGPYTKYILIDEEIIKVQQGTSAGFINVTRGCLGTKAAKHDDGALIRQFYCHFGMFQPKPLTPLFYYIAESTAKAYNEGGFEMIYLDGFESFARDTMTDSRKRFYYYAEFARTILINVEVDPIMEFSCGTPSYLWVARARGGATDNATRAYKNHKIGHLKTQTSFLNYFMTATAGWFNYDPDKGQEFKDVTYRTLYRDDLDHMGSLCLAYNFGTVAGSFSYDSMKEGMRRGYNLYYYGLYTILREADYFSPEVKEQLKDFTKEFKVFQQDDGSWAFKEMKYFKNKVFDADSQYATGNGTNPFTAQTPFVRIEQRYSTLGEGQVVVFDFDEAVPVTDYAKKHSIQQLNIKGKVMYKIRVHGNGSETDAILITLHGVVTSETGRHDMFIPLNFTGWREFIIGEVNNDDYPGYSFSGISTGGVNYTTYRAVVNFDMLNAVQVSLCGTCNDVMIGDLIACDPVDAPVKNPSVTINGQTMTFDATLNSGDYIEYYPEFNKAYLNYYIDHYADPNDENATVDVSGGDFALNEDGSYGVVDKGNWKSSEEHVKEISFSGSLTVPAGQFTYTYEAEALTDATTRAQVVIGVGGNVIENPADWVEPEVEIPEDNYGVITY